MNFIMFTKHIQKYDIPQCVEALKCAGMDGADLCVRPGFPVNPDNVKKALPETVKAFAAEGMSIPLITTPGDMTDPKKKDARAVFEACGKSGVKLIKLGYWHCSAGSDYWKVYKAARRQLEGFAKIAEKTGVKALVHIHSGYSLGLNASAAMHLVNGLDPKHVGIFADPGHLSVTGEPIPMAFSIIRKYAACFAFKDILHLLNFQQGGSIRSMQVVRMGTGYVDWTAVVKTILDLKLDKHPMSIHCEYSGEPAENIVDLAKLDLRFIKKMFASAKAD